MTLQSPVVSNPDAERSVLGSALIDNASFWRVANLVKPEDFYKDSNRHVFRAIVRLAGENRPFDLLTVKEELKRSGKLEEVGGAAYVSSLVDGVPDIRNVERYAEIVRDKSEARLLLRAWSEGIASLQAGATAADAAGEVSTRMTGALVEESRESSGIHDMITRVRDLKDQRAADGVKVGLTTGIRQLDSNLHGLPRGVMVVIAAPTGHGKSAFAFDMALGMIDADERVRGAIYSLEMADEWVAERIMANRSEVALRKIRAWKDLSPLYERHAVDEAIEDLRRWNDRLFVADSLYGLDRILADARKKKAIKGLDFLVLDYLHLVEGLEDQRAEAALRKMSRQLSLFAKQNDITCIVLSQVNKDWQMRKGQRLTRDDLFYASAIGHNARVVLLFQRPREANREDTSMPPCLTFVYLDKVTQGRTGDWKMCFDGDHQRFKGTLCNECEAYGR